MLYSPNEKGQGLVEYSLVLILVAVVVIAILALLGPAIRNMFQLFMKLLQDEGVFSIGMCGSFLLIRI